MSSPYGQYDPSLFSSYENPLTPMSHVVPHSQPSQSDLNGNPLVNVFTKANGILNGGSLLGLGQSLISNGLQLWHDRRMLKDNQAYQQKMIADERAYNDPASQMRRLRDAGINPNSSTSQIGSSDVGNQSPVQGQSSALPAINVTDPSMLPYQQDESRSREHLSRSQAYYTEATMDLVEHTAKNLDANSDFARSQAEKVRQNVQSDSYQTFVNRLKESVLKYHVNHRLANSTKLREAVKGNPELVEFFDNFDWNGLLTGTYEADQDAIDKLGAYIAIALNNSVKFTSEQELMAYFGGIINVIGSVPENNMVNAAWYGHKIQSFNWDYYQKNPNAIPQTFQWNNAFSTGHAIGQTIFNTYRDLKEDRQRQKSPFDSQ